MEFRIADTFTDSLTRLTAAEQRAVKTAAFDLQLNPASPGMHFHRLDRAKDRHFWSVRVSDDVHIIVHRTDTGMLLCFAGHHDPAYAWAERRRLEVHPRTGAAQLVEIRERVEEVIVPRFVEVERPAPPKPALFTQVSDERLLGYGVPAEWIADVRAATEDTLLELADHLPAEASEALLELATGVTPPLPEPVAAGTDPFAHPDALRRFRLMSTELELQRALDYPWEKWTVFLHPAQRGLVERDFNGPARVSGSAGTGKTIVALHRAAWLAHTNPDARVLLTTFSDPLANALRVKVRRLLGDEPRLGERLEVHALDAVGRRLHERNLGRPAIATRKEVRSLLAETGGAAGASRFSREFLLSEWEQVVDAWNLATWEEYRDVARLGRKTRLPEAQRRVLWDVFERVRAGLRERGLVTAAEMFARVTDLLADGRRPPFDFVVVDEAQDVAVYQLRFLAALGGGRPNGLFFAGDLGQRIFQQAFSWRSLGVDVRGRSRTLHVNYRTSHQIRMQADLLLGPEVADVDGNREERRGTVSVFNGPPPRILALGSPEEEAAAVAQWIVELRDAGLQPHEIAVFVRSPDELERARDALTRSGLAFKVLDEHVDTEPDRVSVATMHLAKGLEFRAVAVMACDDEVIPLQSRIESVADEADLEEVYDTERHLLYVACTRARDHLLVTSGDTPSEFLDDMRG
jgi:hypothetical protein